MVPLRGLQRLKAVLSTSGNTSVRRLTNVVQHNDDAVGGYVYGVDHVYGGTIQELVQMENPFKEPQKGCVLCNVTVDFKNIQLLSQFISPHTGRIYGRHITGLCGRKQRQVSKAIKKAHSMGFMSVTHKHPQFMKDPNICGPKHLD